ncbi:ATP-binding protein [Pseudorhodoplanes sp.]|uniref:ATP-binding protein n=1 Tax=Pseudorhodoplanes sp. TaxID=1934341 RepID=UPI002D7FFAF2|nr:ATP-binding protein [Pseudorhodoplanes sp.]
MSMDQGNDRELPADAPEAHARRYDLWLIAGIAVVAIALVSARGDLSAVIAIPAAIAVVAAAWYLGRRAHVEEAEQVASSPAIDNDSLFADVVTALPDPTVLLDAEGRVAAMNVSASTIAPALRIGEPAALALRIPEVIDAIRRASLGRKTERAEFAERVPSGRWFEVFVTPLRAHDDSGAGARLLLTFRDLTPIRRVEEMRVDFVANASHELRTPLAALSGFIETLKGPARNDTAARERFLDIMEGQAKRMARLIDDLLSLSRIELAAHVRPETPVDLSPIVRQVIDALQVLARDRGVTVSIDAPKEPLIVSGNRDELTRVFENLIENALKYGASGKRVEVTLSRALTVGGGEEAVVAVRDYGPGIAAEHLPRLTERFYRVDVTESREQGGTGLGLALVKHIMNRHHGRLTIESRSGEGATFIVRLPISTGTAGSGQKTASIQ